MGKLAKAGPFPFHTCDGITAFQTAAARSLTRRVPRCLPRAVLSGAGCRPIPGIRDAAKRMEEKL